MFPPDLDPRFGRFGLRSDCPSCGANLPVNGPTSTVDCADCGDTTRVPAEIVTRLLEAFEQGWPKEAEHAGSATIGDMTWRWTSAAVAAPACLGCGADLTLRRGSAAVCGACGTAAPVLDAPGWVRSAVQTATVVVGGDVEPRRPDTGDRPVALSCPSCGAALGITGSHLRVTPCDHCGSRVHVPDAMWRALHPARKVLPWFVRFDGESRPARDARAAAERAERDAARLARDHAQRDRQNRAAAVARAERERREADVRRRRLVLTIPLLGLTWMGTAAAVGSTLVAASWVVLGSARAGAIAGLRPFEAGLVGEGIVVTAVACFVPTWLLGIATARFYAGLRLLPVLPWCVVMVVLSSIPFAGPVFALLFGWLHLRGREPTVSADERLAWLTTLPLAVLHPLVGALAHVVYASIGNTTSQGWLPI